MKGLGAGERNRRIKFQRPVVDPDDSYSAGRATWQDVATVWASVEDRLPSRGESMNDGLNMAARPCRIRMLHRQGITSDMRILFGQRILQIVSGPVEIGFRAGLELMAEEYSTAGGG